MPTISLELRLLLDQDELDSYVRAADRADMTVTRWLRRCLERGTAMEVATTAQPASAHRPTDEPPAEPAPPDHEPERKARKRPEPARGDVPRGRNAILAAAEQLAEGRRWVLREKGLEKPRGAIYTKAMRQWYAENGLDGMDVSVRSVLSQMGGQLELIRPWALTQPDIPDNLGPAGLLYRWEHRLLKRLPAQLAKPPTQPSLRKRTAEPVDTTTTFGVIGGRLGRHPVEKLMQGPLEKAEAPAGGGPPPLAGTYASFTEVDLKRLSAESPYDARVLRRFTEKLLTAGRVAEDTPSDALATAIRAIRGKEGGDNPPCAVRLVALGVMWGNSGSFKIRPEYVGRINHVQDWMQ